MWKIAKEIQKMIPGEQLWNTNIDAQMMGLQKS